MDAEARRALSFIRACIAEDRYALAFHFSRRMEERGLFWPDVLTVIDHPRHIRAAGLDRYHHPKWILRGVPVAGQEIEIVCVLEADGTLFITLYWED